MKALVVEDVSAMRDLLKTYLSELGHEVTTCPDAECALDAYRNAFYSLIITDIGLPGMDGLELCQRIRSLPRGALCLVVVITGHDEPETLQAVLSAGADDYLVKPITLKMMKNRVAIMERRYQQRSHRRQVQEELLRYREHLEELVEERTAELKRMNTALQEEIAERRRVKRSLDDSEERYRILVQSATDLMFTLNEQGDFCSVNRKTAENFGFPPGEMIGKNLKDFFPQQIVESRLGILEEIFQSGQPHRFPDVSLETPFGLKWFSTTLSPITEENGQLRHVLAIGRDITIRKQIEGELEEYRRYAEARRKEDTSSSSRENCQEGGRR